jgi:hypothetical protein
MKRLATMHTVPAVAALTVMLACGSSMNSPGFGVGDDGGAGGRSGSSGSGSGWAAASSNGGTSGGSSGGGGGPGFMGNGSPDSGGADAQAACVSGATQSCCSGGMQTCSAAGEISVPTWGPCLSSTGAVVTCAPNYTCTPGENSKFCDAGMEAGPPPPPPAVCTDPTVSTEPKILVGYSPAMGQTVGMTGQIKVWVNDENAPFIAPGEQVDNTTGAITTAGTRTATAADGLLDEPALYIAPASPTNGGTPHFPQLIMGSYNNNPPTRGTFTGGAPIDPVPAGATLSAQYTGEFVWDVSALGLTPGTYTAVFSVHDGDRDRAIGCVTIVIAGA